MRALLLRYFYDRNKVATSARGKKGYSVRISDAKRDLKAQHGLAANEVLSNLNYLLSEGWIIEDVEKKDVRLPSGVVVPQKTSFFKITSSGIDKIEGPSAYTADKYEGIRINATGQNIITVGDGNRVDARFGELAGALVDLRRQVLASQALSDGQKLSVVSDIDTMQSQLAKPAPNKSILRLAWEGVKGFAMMTGLAANLDKVGALLGGLL